MSNAEPTGIAPPFYTEDELDEMYERDPLQAMRISRQQFIMLEQLETSEIKQPNASPPQWEKVSEVLEKARRVLLQDGGDLELIEIAGDVIRVRLKGNCVGCPRAALDLKNVVEKTLKKHFPQITRVENTF